MHSLLDMASSKIFLDELLTEMVTFHSNAKSPEGISLIRLEFILAVQNSPVDWLCFIVGFFFPPTLGINIEQ